MLCNYLDVFERAWATRDSIEKLLPARSYLESVKLKFFEANIEKKKLVELDQLYWKTSFEKCNLVCLSLQPLPCILSFRGYRGSCPSSISLKQLQITILSLSWAMKYIFLHCFKKKLLFTIISPMKQLWYMLSKIQKYSVKKASF